MENALNPNRMVLLNITITISPTASVLVCTISNAIVLHVAMVSDHTYWSKTAVMDHPQVIDSSDGPEVCA